MCLAGCRVRWRLYTVGIPPAAAWRPRRTSSTSWKYWIVLQKLKKNHQCGKSVKASEDFFFVVVLFFFSMLRINGGKTTHCTAGVLILSVLWNGDTLCASENKDRSRQGYKHGRSPTVTRTQSAAFRHRRWNHNSIHLFTFKNHQ